MYKHYDNSNQVASFVTDEKSQEKKSQEKSQEKKSHI
jgi:hypothetical protein